MEHLRKTNITSDINNTLTAEDLTNDMLAKVIPVAGFILTVTFLGFFGNILIIIVYTKHYRKSNFRYFVLCLAYIDLLSCITTLPAEAYTELNWFTWKCDILCKIKSFLNVFTIFASALTFLFLASDRYRKICHPFLRQIEPKLALKLCIASIIISGILASPTVVFWGTQTYNISNGDVTVTVTICEKSGTYADGIYPLTYISSVFAFPVCLSMLFTVFCNVMIAKKLIHSVLSNSVKTLTCLGRETENNSNVEEICLQTDGGSQEHVHSNRSVEPEHHNRGHALKYWRHHSLPSGKLWSRNRCNHASRCAHGCISSTINDINLNEKGKEIHSVMETINEINVNGSVKFPAKGSTQDEGVSPEHSYVGDGNRTTSGLPFNYHIRRESHGDIIPSLDSVHAARSNNNWHTKHRHTIHSEMDLSKADSLTLMGLQQWKIWRQQALMRKTLNSRRKTLIMMILSSVFIITMLIYFSLVVLVADRDGILRNMTTSQTVVFFFFWRLYVINSVINPILYGLLDERFRNGFVKLCCRRFHR